MKKTVSIYEAKTHLSALVERAAHGEEIIVTSGGKPKARLVPLEQKPPIRKAGAWKNKGWIATDFADPLPPEALALFFDRMLIAQAKTEALTLVTQDALIRAYDVDTLWL